MQNGIGITPTGLSNYSLIKNTHTGDLGLIVVLKFSYNIMFEGLDTCTAGLPVGRR